MSFFSELKRRNVIRMAGLYLIGSWLITQVLDTILPMFGAPEWIARSMVILLGIGFIPAIAIAWIFELTPEGLKRDSEIVAEHSIAPQTGRKMERLILVLFALALLFLVFDKFVLTPQRETELVAQTTQQIANNSDSKINSHSIAVLPFVNMSGDKNNEYFSDGISEEILNVLARVPSLQVAARTSSFSFKGKNKEVPEIARELKVRLVLEGSVRKQGERVRITAQLIDASDGYHLWSQTYDRDLSDIFAVQDEIAAQIVAELKLKLEPKNQTKRSSGTKDIKAYDLYLRGMALWQKRGEDNLWQAKDLLEAAIAEDPKFAQAWGGLALTYAVLPDYSAKISRDQAGVLGLRAAEHSIILDPTLPEAYAALSSRDNRPGGDAVTIALLRRAIELRPSFATAYQWLGTKLVPVGEIEDGLAASKKALELDPLSTIVANNYAQMLLIVGRNKDAIAACLPSLQYNSQSELCTQILSMAYLLDGNREKSAELFNLWAKQSPIKGAKKQVAELFAALHGSNNRHSFAVQLSQFDSKSAYDIDSGNILDYFQIPPLLILLGEKELAIEYIVSRNLDTTPALSWGMLQPVMDPIRCDPRFLKAIKDRNYSDLRAEKLCQDHD
jgi:TolB-like protein/tetratricopeptide (TPR) repeat protein